MTPLQQRAIYGETMLYHDELMISNFENKDLNDRFIHNDFIKDKQLNVRSKNASFAAGPVRLNSTNKNENFYGYDNMIDKDKDASIKEYLSKINEEVEFDFNCHENSSKEKDAVINEIAKPRKSAICVPKLQRTKKVYDSLSEKEEARREYSLMPNDTTIEYTNFLIFKSFVLVVLNFTVIFNFYEMSFDPFLSTANHDWHSNLFVLIDFIVDSLVLLEYVVCLFIVFDSNNKLKLMLNGPLKHMRRDGIMIDTLIAIPFDSIYILSKYFQSTAGLNVNEDTLGYFRWIKVIALFRLNDALTKINYYLDLISHIETWVLFYNYAFYFHLSSCLWIYISRIETMHSGGGWIEKMFSDQDKFTIYIASLYFNFTTLFTVGYGDITAKTMKEYVCLVFILISSCLVYAILFSAISTYFTSTVKRSEILSRKKEVLDHYNRISKIPDDLRNKILSFYNSSFKIGSENKSILYDSLPYNLKYELLSKIYGRTLKNFQFFKNCSEEFSFYVLSLLKPLILEKGETLLNVGSSFSDVYYVVYGQLNFYLPSCLKFGKFFLLKPGDNFGEISILENEAIDYKIISSKYKETELLLLSSNKLLDIKNNYPDLFREKIKQSLDFYKNLEKNKLYAHNRLTSEVQRSSMAKPAPEVINDYSFDDNKFSYDLMEIINSKMNSKTNIINPIPCEKQISGFESSNEIQSKLEELQQDILTIKDADTMMAEHRKKVKKYNKKTILLSKSTFAEEPKCTNPTKKLFEKDIDYSRDLNVETNGITIKLIKTFAEDNTDFQKYTFVKAQSPFDADINGGPKYNRNSINCDSTMLLKRFPKTKCRIKVNKDSKIRIVESFSHRTNLTGSTNIENLSQTKYDSMPSKYDLKESPKSKNHQQITAYICIPASEASKINSPIKERHHSIFGKSSIISELNAKLYGKTNAKAATLIERRTANLKTSNMETEIIKEESEDIDESHCFKNMNETNIEQESTPTPIKIRPASNLKPKNRAISSISAERRRDPNYVDDLIKDENMNRGRVNQTILDSYVRGILKKEKDLLKNKSKVFDNRGN